MDVLSFEILPVPVLTIILLSLLSLKLLSARRKQSNGIPVAIGGHPIFGQLANMTTPDNAFRLVVKNTEHYREEGIFTVKLGVAEMIFVSSPDYVCKLLSSTVNLDKASFTKLFGIWFPGGLVLVTGDEWRHDRKLLNKAFHFKNLLYFDQIFNANAQQFCRRVETDGLVIDDLLKAMNGLFLDNVCETSFGVNFKTQLTDDERREYISDIRETIALCIRRSFNPLLHNNFIYQLTPSGRRHLHLIGKLNRISMMIIESRQAARVENSCKTMIDLMLENKSMPVKKIRSQVDMFAAAGSDTTALTTTWCMYFIARHGDVQDGLHDELRDVFGDVILETIDAAECKKLVKLEMAVKETLRMRAPAPFSARRLVEDTEFGPYLVKKGSEVFFNIFGVNHDPKQWPDPHRFDPSRFTDENQSGRHPYAWAPFSGGPRICIGYRYALNAIKVTLATALLRYRLELVSPSVEVGYKMKSLMEPDRPVSIRFVPK